MTLGRVENINRHTAYKYRTMPERTSRPASRVIFLTFLLLYTLAFPAALMSQVPGRGTFLIAGENLTDPNFHRTVVLLLTHSSDGAMGLVINRPTDVKIAGLFEGASRMNKLEGAVYVGGPVALGQLFFLIRTDAEEVEGDQPHSDMYQVMGSVYLVDHRTLTDMIEDGRRPELRVYAGYAGWGGGQLERELARGDWQLLPGDETSVFSPDPSLLWQQLLDKSSSQWVRILNSRDLLSLPSLE
jgi:putative transcriptional regulator